MKVKKRYKVILLSFLLLLCAVGGYLYYQFNYRTTHQPEPESDIIQTNTDAAIYELDDLMKKLEGFDEWFDEEEIKEMKKQKEYGTYIIPGLKETKTIQTDTYRIASCTSMTPQGLAVMEQYLFISAYCHTHDHNSVIYMLDKESHQFIKEIVLPDQSHVGGLAYDPENSMLWVSGHENDTAYTNAFSLQSMVDYNVDQTKLPLFYTQRAPLYTIKRNSFMTYNEEHLYAGFFNKKKNGMIQKYELEENGTLKTEYGEEKIKQKEFTISSKQALPAELSKVSSKVQGIAFESEYLLLSQSYGAMKSMLRVFDRTAIEDKGYKFTDENALISFELPDKLEQIYVYEGKVYLLFESAAYAYRARPMTNVDRVISVNITDEIAKAVQDRDEEEEKKNKEDMADEDMNPADETDISSDVKEEDTPTIDEYLDEEVDQPEEETVR